MSRWTKWVAAQSDQAVVAEYIRRWTRPRVIAPIHYTLTRRWLRPGRDPQTGLWFAIKTERPRHD